MPALSAKPRTYTVVAAEAGYALLCDGKALQTPAGAPLIVPTKALAESMAEEVRASSGKFDVTRMPLTQLAMTAIDVVGKDRGKAVARVARHAESELLCHRADTDDALASEQQKIWQPLLDWCMPRFKAPLRMGAGLMPIAQPPESLDSLRRAIEDYDDFHLAGIDWAAGITGSLVLVLALAEKHLAADRVFHAAELDAAHQMAKWGEDPAALTRHQSIRRDLEICEKWFAALAKKPA
jgi:chaperone required for assembly of F1-ATPase